MTERDAERIAIYWIGRVRPALREAQGWASYLPRGDEARRVLDEAEQRIAALLGSKEEGR